MLFVKLQNAVRLSAWIIVWAVLCSGSFAQTAETEKEAVALAAQDHFRAVLAQDWVELEKDYADEILLMPGNELLKKKQGDFDASKPVKVERSELLTLLRASFKGREPMDPDRIASLLNLYDYQILDTHVGDYAIEPGDPVKTADGKIHFTIKSGDYLVKVVPKKGGDFLLMQFRDSAEQWKIVAEYLD